MKTNEKLKQAALMAELNLLENGKEAEWQPTRAFNEKIDVLLCKRRTLTKRQIVIIAVAVLIIALSVTVLPLLKSGTEEPFEGAEESIISGVEVPVKPEYIPEGYYMNSCTVWADGSLQIEYIDGENKIFFKSYPAEEVDISAFEEIISNIDINGNAGFTANNFNGFANNNVAWNDGNYSYVITNSEGVRLEELVRIALSVGEQ